MKITKKQLQETIEKIVRATLRENVGSEAEYAKKFANLINTMNVEFPKSGMGSAGWKAASHMIADPGFKQLLKARSLDMDKFQELLLQAGADPKRLRDAMDVIKHY